MHRSRASEYRIVPSVSCAGPGDVGRSTASRNVEWNNNYRRIDGDGNRKAYDRIFGSCPDLRFGRRAGAPSVRPLSTYLIPRVTTTLQTEHSRRSSITSTLTSKCGGRGAGSLRGGTSMPDQRSTRSVLLLCRRSTSFSRRLRFEVSLTGSRADLRGKDRSRRNSRATESSLSKER